MFHYGPPRQNNAQLLAYWLVKEVAYYGKDAQNGQFQPDGREHQSRAMPKMKNKTMYLNEIGKRKSKKKV
jgi:hypothetical protein